jgi:hypothetical protein
MGNSISVPWEQIFYGEFDGSRHKHVLVNFIGEWGYGLKMLMIFNLPRCSGLIISLILKLF